MNDSKDSKRQRSLSVSSDKTIEEEIIDNEEANFQSMQKKEAVKNQKGKEYPDSIASKNDFEKDRSANKDNVSESGRSAGVSISTQQ